MTYPDKELFVIGLASDDDECHPLADDTGRCWIYYDRKTAQAARRLLLGGWGNFNPDQLRVYKVISIHTSKVKP